LFHRLVLLYHTVKVGVVNRLLKLLLLDNLDWLVDDLDL
jgi:hypothetical protein